MFPVLPFLGLFYFIVHNGVNTFHVDKPMIYINFFDEVVSNNTSSKLIDKELSTTSTPSNNNSASRVKLDLSAALLKLNDENKTSASYETVFDEFDNPSKADITEISVNESEVDSSTTTRFGDLMDPEFLEPELTRMFFLKAIANLIEHIMEALFTVDDAPKLNDPLSFDYDVAPSRNLKKRDLPTGEVGTKPSETDTSTEHKTHPPKDTSTSEDVKHGIKNIESSIFHSTTHEPGHNKIFGKIVVNLTEHGSHNPSTQVSDHISSHHTTHETTVAKLHTTAEGHETKSEASVKSQHSVQVHPDGKVTHRGKLIAHRSAPENPTSSDEDDMKMFHISDESSLLKDEAVNKRETHFLGGIHQADHEPDEHYTNEDNELKNYNESSSLVTLLLISSTMMILMILVAFGLAVAYLFRKNQSQSGNQNASSLRSAVA